MELKLAIITHRHGTTCYAATNLDKLYSQIHDYCKTYWGDTHYDFGFPANKDKEDVIDMYFEEEKGAYNESYEITSVEVDLPKPKDPQLHEIRSMLNRQQKQLTDLNKFLSTLIQSDKV